MAAESTREEEFLYLLTEGSDLLRAGNVSNARDYFERALLLEPGNEQALNLLGLALHRLEQFKEAEAIFRDLIHNNPVEPSLRLNLAMVLLKTGDLEGARRELEVVIDLNPDHPRAASYMGLVHERREAFASAALWYERAGNGRRADQMRKRADAALSGESMPRSADPSFLDGAPVVESEANRSMPIAPASSGVEVSTIDVSAPALDDATDVVEAPSEQELSGSYDGARGDFDEIPVSTNDDGIDEGVRSSVVSEDESARSATSSSDWADNPVPETGETDTLDTSLDASLDLDESEQAPALDPPDDTDASLDVDAFDLGPEDDLDPVSEIGDIDLDADNAEVAPAVAAENESGAEVLSAGAEAAALMAARADDLRKPKEIPDEGSAQQARSASLGFTLDVDDAKRGRARAASEARVDGSEKEASDASFGFSLRQFGDQRNAFEGATQLCQRSDGSVIVPVDEVAYLRTDLLLSLSGQFEIEPLNRRYRGRRTDSLFGGNHTPMVAVMGSGTAIFDPAKLEVTVLHLTNEELYLVESALTSFSAGLVWENGRLPSEGGPDLDIVHLRGNGSVVLGTGRRLTAYPVRADAPVTLHVEHLVGWNGQVVPYRGDLPGLPEQAERPPVVRFEGTGMVFGT